MGNALTPNLAGRLGKLLRMLSSDKEHEVLAAVRAIMRTLNAEKLDIHTLACAVENGTKVTDKQDFVSVVDASDWLQIAEFCRNRDDRLSEKEQTFINDIMARVVWREPSEKQQKWLLSIFYRLGGRHS